MKKKLLIVALVTAVVLLTGTIVGFAVDVANKNAEAQAAAKAAAKAAEKQANIDKTMQELGVSSDSDAGQVLLAVLQEKEMTDDEMLVYLNASAEMKKMSYEQITAKLEEYKDIDETLAKMSFDEAMKIEGFADRLAQKLMYEQYANAIAVGEPLYEQKRIELSNHYVYGVQNAKERLELIEKAFGGAENADFVSARDHFVFSQHLKLALFAGEMLDIFDARKADGTDINQLNKDMQDVIDYIRDQCGIYINGKSSVEWDGSDIISRYLAGESVEDIVG